MQSSSVTLKELAGEAALSRKNWQHQAACIPYGPALFFSSKDSDIDRAKAICKSCPVQAECLEYALLAREPYGVWGGLDERGRSKAWRTVMDRGPERSWGTAHMARLRRVINAVTGKTDST